MSSVSGYTPNYKEVSLIFDSSQRSNGTNEDYETFLHPSLSNGYDFLYLRNATIPDAGYFFTTPQTVIYIGGTSRTFAANTRYTWQELQNTFQNDFDAVLGLKFSRVLYDPYNHEWSVMWNTLGSTYYSSFSYDFGLSTQMPAQLGWDTYGAGANYSKIFKPTVFNPDNYYIRSSALNTPLGYTNNIWSKVVDKVPCTSGYTTSTIYQPAVPRKIYNAALSPLSRIDFQLTDNTQKTYSLNGAPWVLEVVFGFTGTRQQLGQ